MGCMVTKTSHLPNRYFLALLWAHHILHISKIRVNILSRLWTVVEINCTSSSAGEYTHTHTELDVRVCARAHVCQLLLRLTPDTFRLPLVKHFIDLGKYVMPNNLLWPFTLSSVTLGFDSEIPFSVCIWGQCRDSRSLLHYFRLFIIKRNISLNYKKALCLLWC